MSAQCAHVRGKGCLADGARDSTAVLFVGVGKVMLHSPENPTPSLHGAKTT